MDFPSTASDLCTQCGMCCNGALFDFGSLALEDVPNARAAGLALIDTEGTFGFALPCPALEGAQCRAYAARPETCRAFRCKLLRAVEAEHLTAAEALVIVVRTRALYEAARNQLPAHATLIDARRWRREAEAAGASPAPIVAPALMIALGMLDLQLDQHFRKTSERQIMPRE